MLEVLVEKIRRKKEFKKEGVFFFLNPYSYLMLRNKKLLSEVDGVYIDGKWLCIFLKLFKLADADRVSFDNTSLAPFVFEECEKNSFLVSVVGCDAECLEGFVSYLKKKYPNINLGYCHHGYFDSVDEEKEIIKSIISSGSDVVIAGMGSDKQENFLINLKNNNWRGLAYTCGGFIHQTVSKGHCYYPNWIDKYNLRFIYRIYDEPKLIKRYTVDYLFFVVIFFKDYFLYLRKK